MKCCLALLLACLPALAQLSASDRAAIDDAARKTLAETGDVSASIAIVKDGRIAYVQACGDARLDPPTPARPDMLYKIGSNTKQFVSTSVLLLAEQGRISLDDPVSRYLPDLTRGNEVTIRNLLSHTSGYQDYYPLDYVAPFMFRPTSLQNIVDIWAKKPLDFDPGTEWQYSNTNYTIAGLIIEKLSGQTLFEFMRIHIFVPLGMHTPIDADHEKWNDSWPVGYQRAALGPQRPARIEGIGWLNAAGELAMTAGDLARWDIALMNGTLLKPGSLRALTKEMDLKNGEHTGYALGLGVSNANGRRRWAHNGGTAGFTSFNVTRPDDRVAVAVLTNSESGASGKLGRQIEQMITARSDSQESAALERVKQIFNSLEQGRLDRTLLDSDANSYFTDQVIADYAASVKPLGTPDSLVQTASEERGGMTWRGYTIHGAGKSLRLSTFFTPDGKVAQYLIYPQ